MRTIAYTPPAQKKIETKIVIGAGATNSFVMPSPARHDKNNIGFDSIVILYDHGVEPIAKKIAATLPDAHLLAVKSGDASKSIKEVEHSTALILEKKCTRQTLIINIGGGMITDLGGFIASIYMRGVPFIHVPTTMLAMIDASIGGKNGVNLGETKNILGTISHPRAIVIDTDLLKDIPEKQLREGLVEVIKIAAVADKKFFEWLEENMQMILNRDEKILEECIARSAELKARIVEKDERDELVRLHLNYGHTVGHALEACSSFALSHGEAVSIGMIAESTMLKAKGADRIQNLLIFIGMPTTLPQDYTPEELWKRMQSDKKNTKGEVRVAVPVEIGKTTVSAIEKDQFLMLFT